MYCINFCSYFFIKRWVWAYRKDRFNVAINTNNGIERQNRSFKYDFLAKQRDTSLSGMLTVLVTQFLPSSFRRFVLCNSILFYFPSVDIFFHTLHFPHFLIGQ